MSRETSFSEEHSQAEHVTRKVSANIQYDSAYREEQEKKAATDRIELSPEQREIIDALIKDHIRDNEFGLFYAKSSLEGINKNKGNRFKALLTRLSSGSEARKIRQREAHELALSYYHDMEQKVADGETKMALPMTRDALTRTYFNPIDMKKIAIQREKLNSLLDTFGQQPPLPYALEQEVKTLGSAWQSFIGTYGDVNELMVEGPFVTAELVKFRNQQKQQVSGESS